MKFNRLFLLPAASGLLLALAFPRFDLFLIAWVALVPLFAALGNTRNLKESLLCGAVFGVVFFGVHLSWLFSLYRFVEWWIVPGWGGLVLFQTLFILVFALVFRLFVSDFLSARVILDPFQPEVSALVGCRRKESLFMSGTKRIFYALTVSVLWVFVEWLRALGPFGVTGGVLGYTQVRLLPLIQIASFSSVYGVSFLVALFNVSLSLFLLNLRKWQPLIFSLLLIALCAGYGARVLNEPSGVKGSRSITDVLRGQVRTLKVALVQPNIDQKDKMDAGKVNEVFGITERMTRQAALSARPDLVVWPETAVFTYLADDPVLFARLRQILIETNSWLVTGTPYYHKGRAYNSIISVSPRGEIVSRYDKERPVPFGEYLPFRTILYPLLKEVGYYDGEFSGNPDPHPVRVKDLSLAAAVCFESTFPSLIKKRVRKDSSFILVLTNDAWFGESSAPYYHINTGIMRAVENRRYFVQAGNTGFSAVIDPYGRVLKRSELNKRETLIFEIPLP